VSSASPAGPEQLRSVIFELTRRCNLSCRHCYNVWKNPWPYPVGDPDTAFTLRLLEKVLVKTGVQRVTLSGGEPLLRPDLPELVDFLAAKNVSVNLITNGTLLDEPMIRRLTPGKIGVFELPLLSVDRSVHDRMSGCEGAFDRTTLAVSELKLAGAKIVGVFVATRDNIDRWKETAELGLALGLDGLLFNRFNPGGAGGSHWNDLQVPPALLQQALDEAEAFSEEYEFPISCSIAMPPCLIKTDRYKRLTFGFCAAGTDRAYYTVDPLGNLRPCNHSPRILGNLMSDTFAELVRSEKMVSFMNARPDFCRECRFELSCQGGCKAAAEACFGSPSRMDPFLQTYHAMAQKL